MGLEIGHGPGIFILLAQPCHLPGDLLFQRSVRRRGEISAAAAAEDASAGALGAVQIGAGEACVNGGFVEFVSPGPVFKGQGMVQFVFIGIGKICLLYTSRCV